LANPLDRLAEALKDRYTLERELGAGGMATVYLAHDLKHDRKVAIKVLRPELAAVLGAERLVQEIKTTANLQHPNILPLFDSGEADGFLYYVMPYVEGETLRAKLNRETQLGVEAAVKLTTEVADALDYAHQHNVIHRDIKPENILLHDGRPMVMDFGIALAVSAAAGSRMTETGLSLGTPHYMSPEQATAEKQLTHRSDIYSLGAVLYEMLTGDPPHTGSSAQAIILKIVSEEPAPVTTLRKTVPPHVAAAVAQALEKLAADRFDSAKAFADALADPAFTSATVARTTPTVAPSSRLTVVLAALVVVLAVAFVWVLQRGQGGAASARVVRFSVPLAQDTTNAQAPQVIPRFGSTQLAFSPDGRRLVYAMGRALYEHRLDQDTDALLVPAGVIGVPFFSPDGAWVGFLARGEDGGRELRRLSLADRSVETVGTVDTLGITGLTWGDDGTIVADDWGLVRIPASGGEWEEVALPEPPPGEVHRWFQPHMLPGSRIVLFHAARSWDPEHADIVALDLTTGEERTVVANAMHPIYSPTGHLLFLREGTLLGAGFDPGRAEVRGQPVVLIGDVMQSLYGINFAHETGAAQVALSAAGDLAFARGGVGRPAAMNVVRVTPRGDTIPIAMGRRDWTQFRLSPDGNSLAAISRVGPRHDVWIHDLTREVTRRLNTGGFLSWSLAWSPDGDTIVFTSDRDRPGNDDLFRMPADGSGEPKRLVPSGSGGVVADWSSQGVIAYLRNRDIWVIPPDSAARPFLASEAEEMYPSFSPDGRWLAYTSNESGGWAVYVRPYPGGEPATLVANRSAGGEWSRDGRTLFYVDIPSRMIMAVDVAPGPAFRPGRARPHMPWVEGFTFSPISGVDVFPDGSYVFAVNDPATPPQPCGAFEIHVILNFAEELKARVGR
jgi:serine/threonine-protein kinase